jgi:Uma2 family endonuclease
MTAESTVIAPPPRVIQPEVDPWRYGWRETREMQPTGAWYTKRVPLKEEDVLHPQEGDFIVEPPAHDQDCLDLKNVLQWKTAGRLGIVVLHNCRVDWGVPGVGAHGPDIALLEHVGVWDPRVGTFHVAQLGARPLLVIEVTSPATRNVDLDEKVVEYFRAGVPLYVIVDRGVADEGRGFRLLGYEATPRGYVRMALNDQGQLRLEPLGLWLGLDGDRAACFDEHGTRLGTYVEVALRLEAEAEARQAATARADALQQRILQLEAELRKRDNPPS